LGQHAVKLDEIGGHHPFSNRSPGSKMPAGGESNIMLTASNLPPRENELVAREIQEIRDALEAFKTAFEA
jgi:hypothetical protein